MSVTAKDILTRASQILKNGWIKGRLSDIGADGRMLYCSLGAMSRAANEYGFTSYSEQFSRALEELEGACGTSAIAAWNDHPNTTFAEVMNVFDLAIRRASA